jgi:hypothetical protein
VVEAQFFPKCPPSGHFQVLTFYTVSWKLCEKRTWFIRVFSFLSFPGRKSKLYVADPSEPIPRRTAMRKRFTDPQTSSHPEDGKSTPNISQMHVVNSSEDIASDYSGAEDITSADPQQENVTSVDPQEEDITSADPQQENVTSVYPQEEDIASADPQQENVTSVDPQEEDIASEDPHTEIVTAVSSLSDNVHVDIDAMSVVSNDNETSSNGTCSSKESYDSWSDSEISDEEGEEELEQELNAGQHSRTKLEVLSILSFVIRHKLSGVAVHDLVNMINLLDKESHSKKLVYSDIYNFDSDQDHKMYYYCSLCYSIIQDGDFDCSKDGCPGVRMPKMFFIMANVKSQLQCILTKEGVWEKISTLKTEQQNLPDVQEVAIRDIYDGIAYKRLCVPHAFLSNPFAISALFNTDGVQLYKCTGEKLWPIYLAVNELPVELRYCRENMVLIGMWQGKGSPPFHQYMSAFSDVATELYNEGVEIEGVAENVKMAVIVGTMDLQAKCSVLNMTAHNGKYGCVTCVTIVTTASLSLTLFDVL